MKRIGTVLVFREGVSPEEAAKALEKIREILDLPEKTSRMVVNPDGRTCHFVEIPFEMVHKVEEYDDECGGPVWYIP
jgi:hypothetical protein